MRPQDPGDRAVRERLRSLRVDPPGGDFEASLRRRLVAAGPPAPVGPWQRLAEALRRPRLAWPAALASGAVAAAALFLVLSPPRSPAGAPQGAVAADAPAAVARVATRLPASRVAVVRLVLAAEVPVEGALVRVTLPPGLAFWSDGAEVPQRTFEWTQALAAGDNEIPIAVRGRVPGHYRIAVHASAAGERIEDEVVIEVVDG